MWRSLLDIIAIYADMIMLSEGQGEIGRIVTYDLYSSNLILKHKECTISHFPYLDWTALLFWLEFFFTCDILIGQEISGTIATHSGIYFAIHNIRLRMGQQIYISLSYLLLVLLAIYSYINIIYWESFVQVFHVGQSSKYV